MALTKLCAQCHKPFTLKRITKLFCSDQCRSQHHYQQLHKNQTADSGGNPALTIEHKQPVD